MVFTIPIGKTSGADFLDYIVRVANLGFDVMEMTAHHINDYSSAKLNDIRQCAKDNNILLTAGIGPSKENNLSSPDASIRNNANEFFKRLWKISQR